MTAKDDAKKWRLRSPTRWHGGKFYLAKELIARMPEHVHYVEPYFGGGSVLLAKPAPLIEGHSEVVNDINGALMNFWNVLTDAQKFDWFYTSVSLLPLSESLFREAKARLDRDSHQWGSVEWAVDFFVCYRQSRQGLGKDFGTLSRTRTRRGMNEQVAAWIGAIDGLPDCHERLKRVCILNQDAISVIKSQDDVSTFFYLDPPYLHESRTVTDAYQYEMTEEQHEELLQTLEGIKGRFMLSGYPTELYDKYAKRNGWRSEQFEIDNKASSSKSKEIKVEVVWTNYGGSGCYEKESGMPEGEIQGSQDGNGGVANSH